MVRAQPQHRKYFVDVYSRIHKNMHISCCWLQYAKIMAISFGTVHADNSSYLTSYFSCNMSSDTIYWGVHSRFHLGRPLKQQYEHMPRKLWWQISVTVLMIVHGAITDSIFALRNVATHYVHIVDIRDVVMPLTHCGLVTPYGGGDLGQHWFM